MRRERSWWATLLVLTAFVVLFVVACGPEANRTRNGGTGGSSRPAAPPTTVSAPELVVQPTTNIPYATEGPLPTLRPAPAAGGTPATPGFAVPTGSPGNFPVGTPGTPSR